MFDEGFDTQDSSPRDAVILLCHARCVLVSELLTAWRGALVTRQIVVVNYGRQQFLSEAASAKKKVSVRGTSHCFENILPIVLHTASENDDEDKGANATPKKSNVNRENKANECQWAHYILMRGELNFFFLYHMHAKVMFRPKY